MQVIPVIDVRGGVAVAASRGDRARYRPLETPLAASSDPVAVALGLRSLFPFKTLYVADLDGIEGRGADVDTQKRLADVWPGQEIWIDDGNAGSDNADVGIPPLLSSPSRGEGRSGSPLAQQVPSSLWGGLGWGETRDPLIKSQLPYHVLGSESLTSLEDYEQARRAARPAAPLSLDFRGDSFVGPPELLADASHWPDRVIVMTLARVGSGEGPDLARLGDIVQRAGKREIYAAGGVRDANDLRALRDIGAAGALIATALHNGSITARDLEAFA
jgi:uncharacterized protein related to proFAR isomerase